MRSHRKKQNYFLIVMIALSVAICIVHNWKPGRHVGEYTFWRAESMKDLEAMAGTSHVYGPPQVSLETDARFRGALLALFGNLRIMRRPMSILSARWMRRAGNTC